MKTPVQKFFVFLLDNGFIGEDTDDRKIENYFDDIIKEERDVIDKAFTSGMFAKHKADLTNISPEQYEYYYKIFPDE